MYLLQQTHNFQLELTTTLNYCLCCTATAQFHLQSTPPPCFFCFAGVLVLRKILAQTPCNTSKISLKGLKQPPG